MGDPGKQQKAEHINRLNEEFLNLPFADRIRDARRQAGHAGKRPADVDEQQIRDGLPQRVAGKLVLGIRAGAGKHRAPEQDRRDHRKEAQQAADEKVATVVHALDERDAKDIQVFAERMAPGQ